MKQLNIKHLQVSNINAKDIPALFNEQHIAFENIDCVNWKEDFPYAPKVSFRIAYTNTDILIHYQVNEEDVRALTEEDNGRVWEDACCEFFCSPEKDGTYYNIEANCIGTVLVGYGAEREGRVHAPVGVVRNIKRWSSLGDQPFNIKSAPAQWEMALVIPFTVFFKHNISSLEGKTIKGNFYKCGDKLPKPHFLSWNFISLPRPDFHCPPFFGELIFEK